MPRVSIVTPTYNHAEFIGECIESVLAQGVTDWELIVVDDTSTDGTVEIVRTFKDPRIKLVFQEHKGVEHLATTYNHALEASHGEFVAILEGDDYWPPDKLERQLPLFDEGVVLVSGRRSIVDRAGNPVDVPENTPSDSAKRNHPIGEGTIALLDVRHLTFTFPVATMLRRSALEQIGGFQQPPYLSVVDLPTFVAISRLGEFRWEDGVCGYWRRHEGSTTLSKLPTILDGAYRFAGEWYKSESQVSGIDPAKLEAWRDDWSAFMVHRFVLLSNLLKYEGDLEGAKRAAQMSSRFKGPVRRKLKSLAARVAVRLPLSDPLFRRVTSLGQSTNEVAHFDRLVDKGMIDRVEPWY